MTTFNHWTTSTSAHTSASISLASLAEVMARMPKPEPRTIFVLPNQDQADELKREMFKRGLAAYMPDVIVSPFTEIPISVQMPDLSFPLISMEVEESPAWLMPLPVDRREAKRRRQRNRLMRLMDAGKLSPRGVKKLAKLMRKAGAS